jgi:hypothetical protein
MLTAQEVRSALPATATQLPGHVCNRLAVLIPDGQKIAYADMRYDPTPRQYLAGEVIVFANSVVVHARFDDCPSEDFELRANPVSSSVTVSCWSRKALTQVMISAGTSDKGPASRVNLDIGWDGDPPGQWPRDGQVTLQYGDANPIRLPLAPRPDDPRDPGWLSFPRLVETLLGDLNEHEADSR